MKIFFCWSFPAIPGAGEFCHSGVVCFAHALVIYRKSPVHVHVLTQKSEEATASSSSLLATPLHCNQNRKSSLCFLWKKSMDTTTWVSLDGKLWHFDANDFMQAFSRKHSNALQIKKSCVYLKCVHFSTFSRECSVHTHQPWYLFHIASEELWFIPLAMDTTIF